MMKNRPRLATSLSLLLNLLLVSPLNVLTLVSASANTPPRAFFSPNEGEQAFTEIYSTIASAKREVLVTVYSWSDRELDQAILSALSHGARVRMVLHPDLTSKSALMDRATNLELKGAEVKIAVRNMHEKFIIVDRSRVINSSANFSSGARTKYSENIVFFDEPSRSLSEVFLKEFAIIWDSAKDLISHGETTADPMGAIELPAPSQAGEESVFLSSSMNLDLTPNSESSAARKLGKFINVRLAPETPWVIRDLYIQSIDQAQRSIECSFNHFNIKEISDALLRAVRRGVDVKLTVDEQEFRERVTDSSIEMTPRFVAEWSQLFPGQVPPVRVKMYSLQPDPAHWLLNHHKYMLVDFDPRGALLPSTRLLSGSYNLSETAEHNQFDNMIVFVGENNRTVMESFHREFLNLWGWGRSQSDEINLPLVQSWLTPKEGSLFLHFNQALSMTWPEVVAFRKEVRKLSPGLVEKLNRNSGSCVGYSIEKRSFFGCRTN